ncbi:MAG: hypothetical protein JWL68_404, partial [Actinomycetia bacterium]|nr:hypothetical protein [Actinomycetes bacterium]
MLREEVVRGNVAPPAFRFSGLRCGGGTYQGPVDRLLGTTEPAGGVRRSLPVS